MLYTLKQADEESLAGIQEEKKVRGSDEMFLLFSLGSQFDHLIKQEVEKLGVFCLVADSRTVRAEDVARINPTGIILSGGPTSVYEDQLPFDVNIFDIGIPVLGICLGFQLWAKYVGAEVVSSKKREFSTHRFSTFGNSELFKDCPVDMQVLMSHGDKVLNGVTTIEICGTSENAPIAAGCYKHLFGVQFHPEVSETENGSQIFENFLFKICGAKDVFPAEDVAKRKISETHEIIRNKKVLLALSGGSDSSTVEAILEEARWSDSQIRAVYIKAVDRPDDEKFVRDYFGNKPWLDLVIIDATDRFLNALHGAVTMKDKRLAMRGIYKEILEEEAEKFGNGEVEVLIAQGTLYTDISESGGGYDTGAKKAQIKLHHNVNLDFSYKELLPLSDCVKDSGRNIGRAIGVPEVLLTRHPFPGPGLIVRIEDLITREKLEIARQADGIFIEELRNWKLYDTVWQAGAVVTRSVTTCTKGDDAVSGIIIALWAVWSVNGFTARAAELPYDFLKLVSRRITNEIRDVGAVVYRTSDKPPATIEWG